MFLSMFYVAFLLLIVRICQGLDILNFHEHCGSTIDNNAGDLRFDSHKLPSDLDGNKCSVTISPQSVQFYAKTQVLFYFTKFDLSIFCEDTNVTVIDGTLFSGIQIQGLPSHMCGHNTTLEKPDQIFTTNSNQLTVVFKRSNYGRRFSGNFSIKYVEFHTGDCEEQDTYQCSNDRCIPNDYHCSNEINACGYAEDDCTDDAEENAKSFLDSVVNILRNLMWIGAIVIGIYILKHFYRRYHGRIRSAFIRVTEGRRQENRRPSVGSHSVHLETLPTEDTRIPDRENTPEQTLLSSDRISSASSSSSVSSMIDNGTLPSNGIDPTSGEPQQTNAIPSCPPPSYEDVVGDK